MNSSVSIKNETLTMLGPKSGMIYLTLSKNGYVVERREYKNVVVRSASILTARLFKNNLEPSHGAFLWAVGVGAGDSSPGNFDLQNPPAATIDQTTLRSELVRKQYSSTNFVDSDGAQSSTPTNIVDFSVTFTENEAVGPLTEMGLFGGDADEEIPNSGTLITYRTFAVFNKPAGSTLNLLWRLTF